MRKVPRPAVLALWLGAAVTGTSSAGSQASSSSTWGPHPETADGVIRSASIRLFPGGRTLPGRGDAAANRSRLGLTLRPGLEVDDGHTVHVFAAPPELPADGGPALPPTGRLVTLHAVSYRGVPLAPGSDVLTVATADGRVLALRQRNLPTVVDGVHPTVDAASARQVALEAGRGRGMPVDAEAGAPVLQVFVDRWNRGRLAWTLDLASASLTAPWRRTLWIAAIGEPEVLADRQGIFDAHAGTARAKAWTDTPLGASPVRALPHATVSRSGSGGGSTVTNAVGFYGFPEGVGIATMRVRLSGPHVAVENVPGIEVSASATGVPGTGIDLLVNATTEQQLAQTSAFVWVNRAHALTEGFRPPQALARLPVNVNLDGSCNAFWNGSALNFYRSSSDCVNTAYSDVVLHEYGHAVDESLGGILDEGYSEGFGDALSLLGTRQTACVGRDLRGEGTCERHATDVLHWPPNIVDWHHVGHHYTGFVSALITELRRTHATDDAFEIARQLVLGAAAANPSSVPDAVGLSFLVDDDDGSLANGTPHCAELAAAADSRSIPRPSCAARHVRTTADLDADGRADIVGFDDAGVWTALSNGDGTFQPERFVLAQFGALQGWDGRHVRTLADLDADGRPDIVGFGPNGVWTAVSNGDGTFAPARFVQANLGFQQGWSPQRHARVLADLDADGRADIVGFGDAGVWTALSNGNGAFSPARLVRANFGANQGWTSSAHVRLVKDVDGDRRADIVAYGFHGVWTALSAGDGTFAPERLAIADFGNIHGWNPAVEVRTLGDLDGGGRADVVAFGFHGIWTALAAEDGLFGPRALVLADLGSNGGWTAARHIRRTADLGDDGLADVVAFGETGVSTAIARGNGAFEPARLVLSEFGEANGWRLTEHVRTMADVDGDGRDDIVAFGVHGVWTALSRGDGTFEPPRFVLARFGTQQGWRGGQE